MDASCVKDINWKKVHTSWSYPQNVQQFTCILVIMLLLFLSGCGIAQNSQWYAFTDSLGTGSQVQPAKGLMNSDLDIDVQMTKAADPKWDPNTDPEYPYAGIVMFFKRSKQSVDISAAQGLTLSYQLAGEVTIMLGQEGIPAGKEYRAVLPPSGNISEVHIPWKNFTQPSWVNNPVPLDLTRVFNIMFLNASKKHSTAKLTISDLSFPGWEHPDYIQTKIKRLLNRT